MLEEINDLAPARDKDNLLASRGENAITALINIMEMIDVNYDVETAQDLQKRILLSSKNRDPERFNRGVKKLRNEK